MVTVVVEGTVTVFVMLTRVVVTLVIVVGTTETLVVVTR